MGCNCSNKVIVKFKKVNENATIPKKAHPSDACYDLTSAKRYVVGANQTELIDTGLQMALPLGYEAQIRSRSGLSLKKGIVVKNAPGTIDANYRNNVGIILYNTTDNPFIIEIGDRIAQMKISEVLNTELIEVDSLDETDRGNGGFGSTGV